MAKFIEVTEVNKKGENKKAFVNVDKILAVLERTDRTYIRFIEEGEYILHPIYFIGIDCDDTELSYSHTPSAFEFTYDITDWFYREVIND